MPGGAAAVASGADLEREVVSLAARIGLAVRRQVKVGRRLWGAERSIDVVISRPASNQSLGIECKWQGVGGSAEEKIPATIQDIAAWPIPRAGRVHRAGLFNQHDVVSALDWQGRVV